MKTVQLDIKPKRKCFILVLKPKMRAYLDWKSKQTGKPIAQIIREELEKDMNVKINSKTKQEVMEQTQHYMRPEIPPMPQVAQNLYNTSHMSPYLPSDIN